MWSNMYFVFCILYFASPVCAPGAVCGSWLTLPASASILQAVHLTGSCDWTCICKWLTDTWTIGSTDQDQKICFGVEQARLRCVLSWIALYWVAVCDLWHSDVELSENLKSCCCCCCRPWYFGAWWHKKLLLELITFGSEDCFVAEVWG